MQQNFYTLRHTYVCTRIRKHIFIYVYIYTSIYIYIQSLCISTHIIQKKFCFFFFSIQRLTGQKYDFNSGCACVCVCVCESMYMCFLQLQNIFSRPSSIEIHDQVHEKLFSVNVCCFILFFAFHCLTPRC